MHAPLSGVRILDLSAVVSGPMAAGILADQGADVIKVETQGGDLTRRVGPIQGDMTSLFATINRGKRSIVLDLKQAEARSILRELVEKADVLVEYFRPGAMARLGFAYEQVKVWNPRIVYLSISGFGQTGPYSGYRVYDPVIQAVSGFADAHPDPETQEPRLLQTLMCDKITALTAAQAITAINPDVQVTALQARADAALLDTLDRSLHGLDGLLTQFLDYARAAHPAEQAQPAVEVALREFLAETLALAPGLPQPTLAAGPAVTRRTRPQALRRLVLNLIGNLCRHTNYFYEIMQKYDLIR